MYYRLFDASSLDEEVAQLETDLPLRAGMILRLDSETPHRYEDERHNHITHGGVWQIMTEGELSFSAGSESSMISMWVQRRPDAEPGVPIRQGDWTGLKPYVAR